MSIRNLFGKAKMRLAASSDYGYNDYDDREGYYQNLLTERSGESLLYWSQLYSRAIANARVEVRFRDIEFQRSPQKYEGNSGSLVLSSSIR